MTANTQAVAQVTAEILDAFRTGRLAEPLAQTFLNHGLHCERWSLNNQMVVHLLGHGDAATYNQWREMGRQVKRGCKAFYLMRPHALVVHKTDEATGEERAVQVGIRGFGWFPVHAYEDTIPIPEFPGEVYDLAKLADKRKAFIANLPLVEVAQSWGIDVSTYRARNGGSLGWAIPGKSIGLGVANLSTWTHELVHQAEHRLGTLTLSRGQDRDNEIVAELGGAVLLTVLGHKTDADWGGAYRYIQSYARAKDGEALLPEILRVTGRMAAALQHILDTAQDIQTTSGGTTNEHSLVLQLD